MAGNYKVEKEITSFFAIISCHTAEPRNWAFSL
jgi:hypothetical protein